MGNKIRFTQITKRSLMSTCIDSLRQERGQHLFYPTPTLPAGCTGELQPMDLSVNGDFKRAMKSCFTKWYAEEVARKMNNADQSVDLRLSIVKPIHARWLIECLDTLAKDKEMTRQGWRLAGLIE